MTNDELKIYLLGIFDGEGCICPSFRKDGYVALFVTVSMASEEVIDLLQNMWGGSKSMRRGAKAGYLDRFTWTMTGSRTIPFLEYASKRLITKRKQAEYALILAHDLTRWKRERHGINNHAGEKCLTEADHARRREIGLKIKALNGARSRYAKMTDLRGALSPTYT